METTIDSLLDKAVDKLPPVRRLLYRRLLTNKKNRENVSALLITKLENDEDACSCLPVVGDASFTASTPFSIDPDNLDKFLAIIVKYLPMILEIIFKFFV